LIEGISHIAVRVTDMEKSLQFYRDVLGFAEQFRLAREDGSVWLVYLKVGKRQFVELFPGAEGPFVRPNTAALVHICLEVDDIQATYRELTARGLVAHKEPMLGADGSWQFWTNDPDGNPIEFHQFTAESRQLRG